MKINRIASRSSNGWFYGLRVVGRHMWILGVGSRWHWSKSSGLGEYSGQYVLAACYGPFTFAYHE